MSDVLYYVIPVVLILGYAAVRRRLRGRYWIFRGGLLDHPVDFLRRPLTKGLQVSTGAQEVRRGDEVEALVTISRSSGLGNVEVGLICIEYYDYEATRTNKDGTQSSSRETAEATAYEAWQPVESAQGVLNVRLAIPPEAPFSYKGDCLSFKWDLVVKGSRRGRLDKEAGHELFVLP